MKKDKRIKKLLSEADVIIKKADLEMRLSRAIYGQAGMFPHPEWFKEEEYCRKELAKLEKKRKRKT